VEGQFALVYVAFNTFFALPTQDDQLRCFAAVASRLAPGGRFVIEAFVPDLTRFTRDQTLLVQRIDTAAVHLEATRHDAAAQRVWSQHVVVREDGIRLFPVELRYAWPSELDLMARLAGLHLAERWGGWARQPFTAASAAHVSVYARPVG